ncbi:MAG TPA: hypothetical protein VK403_05815 [Allosphingosinicella sp.]|nr:hypothetical protein [Allosphingosinicella sp.]
MGFGWAGGDPVAMGEAGEGRRWDAALDEAAQRQMGHALLALLAAPFCLLLPVFADGALLVFGAAVTLPPAGWGALALSSLYLRTGDPSLRP